MTKVFKIQDTSKSSDAPILLPNSGTFETTALGASIEYVFDNDCDVELTINRQYFSREDVLELRSFLDAVIEYQLGKGV